MNKTLFFKGFLALISVVSISLAYGQQTPIINYSSDVNGQVQLEVNSSTANYYILNVRHHPDSAFVHKTSMTLGQANTTIITEPLGNYPEDHYEVLEYPIASPNDSDGDGIDDITEFNAMPVDNPINFADPIDEINGLTTINNLTTFNTLSIQLENVQFSPFLDGKKFVKYIILDFDTPDPKVYFINTNTHALHADFGAFMGVDHLAPSTEKGQVVYHPNVLSNNGTLGTYAFNYSNNESLDFATVQRTHELLAASMPLLHNNLSYYINVGNEGEYNAEIAEYQDSRVSVLFESDVYAGLDYWGLNQKEGFGFFRQVSLNEVPGSKDIVLYDALPNSLPRVGGIITSVIQTPLSHVNLRAIQQEIPNAFIRDPLDIDTIADLLNHYIYFKVEQSSYTIREATLEEVNAWYESHRPTEAQTPPLNLEYENIKPLDEVTFHMFDGFGAKSANVATMRRFGFVDKTIPDGFAIPFYFYQEFMKFNNFFNEIELIMADPLFIADRDYRDVKLEEFRDVIEDAEMPDWMMTELADMHAEFPVGSSVRCRSSTNNEDLPGFSGAGLYDSKTQNPSEGHISKSIKQVFASLWNLRAFEERDFYRIDHFQTSMGVLCHLNFSDEIMNGVGVSADPIYNTSNTFYLNSQLASELITNPNGTARPEELLLNRYPTPESSYSVIQYSSLVPGDSLLMTEVQMNQLRSYLSIIHDEFAILYHAEDNETFAMDIEYKITSDNRLVIKQARPWVSYVEEDYENPDECELFMFPNPADIYINVTSANCRLTSLKVFDLAGRMIIEKELDTSFTNAQVDVSTLSPGIYIVAGYLDDSISTSKKFLIR
jgi:hypothetical protein